MIKRMPACISATACTVFATAFFGTAAIAQDVNGVTPLFKAAKDNFALAWVEQNLAFTSAKFIAAPAKGYGSYQPLQNNEFAPGTPLTVYAEPVGYGFKQQNSQYHIDLSVDFELRNTTGQVLASQDGFAVLHAASFNQVREYQSSLSFDLKGLQEGEYVLKVRFNDNNSEKSGAFELPFKMKTTN